ncbi:MAG: hypothetical protein IT472_01240 [Thermomonas sp.]|uniref:hypothetical protein n=1 Tax=Thermomonas sp. TaxID=1971895 RepID=UPI002611BB3A|nr:hypothetical protein [Thermomonas sp.]MCC7095794.1 hypothetical protein [Thermomonas sp.]
MGMMRRAQRAAEFDLESKQSMERNPYLPPEADVHDIARGDCWRESGGTVYVARGSDLPQRCVKCNTLLVQRPKRKTYYWHASGWYLLILLNIILYAIAAMIARKKIEISAGLCDQHRKRRWLKVGSALGLFVLMFVAGVVMFGGETSGISVACFAGSVVAFVAGVIFARVIYPVEITERGGRFKGCGPEFLASLAAVTRGNR